MAALPPVLREALANVHAHWHEVGKEGGLRRDVLAPMEIQKAAAAFCTADAWVAPFAQGPRKALMGDVGVRVGGGAFLQLLEHALGYDALVSSDALRRAARELYQVIKFFAPQRLPLMEALYLATCRTLSAHQASTDYAQADRALRRILWLVENLAAQDPTVNANDWKLHLALDSVVDMVQARNRIRQAAHANTTPNERLAKDALCIINYYGWLGIPNKQVELMLYAAHTDMALSWKETLDYMARLLPAQPLWDRVRTIIERVAVRHK